MKSNVKEEKRGKATTGNEEDVPGRAVVCGGIGREDDWR